MTRRPAPAGIGGGVGPPASVRDVASITLAPSVQVTLLVLLGVAVLARLVALVVIPSGRRPSSAVAWLLAVYLVPVLGWAAFLVIGSPRLPRRVRERQRDVKARVREHWSPAAARLRGTGRALPDDRAEEQPSWLDPVVLLQERLGGFPMEPGCSAELLPGYEEALASMTEAVGRAERFVHVQTYVLSYDEVTAPLFQALQDAVARGVTVRVLADHLGSAMYPGYRRTRRRLDETGTQWREGLPVHPLRGRYRRPDLRDHRKLVVVDGTVVFAGSGNLIERGYRKRSNHREGVQWVDLWARLDGPVVRQLDAVFAEGWYVETGELVDTYREPLTALPTGPLSCQVVPSGPGCDAQNNLALFTTLLHGARRRVTMTTPYFVPEESLLLAMRTAAARGVEVELFLPAEGNHFFTHHAGRSFYGQVLQAGVRVHLFEAPHVLHDKHVTVDDDVAALGSSNLDVRSFDLDLEVMTLVHGRSFVDRVREVEEGYRARSTELRLEDWQQRSVASRLLDNVARLTSALQ